MTSARSVGTTVADDSAAAFGAPLPVSFYARPTLLVARDLLGRVVCRRTGEGLVAARIVEVEAYIGQEDPACHAHCGRTPRNVVMWGEAGHAYIYFSYGVHWMLNLVTEAAGEPCAVLVRAAVPLAGGRLIEARCPRQRPEDWLVGPGRLARGLALAGADNGLPLTSPALELRAGAPVADGAVRQSGRVGISVGQERPWRLFVAGARVSRPRQPSGAYAPAITTNGRMGDTTPVVRSTAP